MDAQGLKVGECKGRPTGQNRIHGADASAVGGWGFLQPLKHQAAERSFWQQKTLPVNSPGGFGVKLDQNL